MLSHLVWQDPRHAPEMKKCGDAAGLDSYQIATNSCVAELQNIPLSMKKKDNSFNRFVLRVHWQDGGWKHPLAYSLDMKVGEW